MREATPTLTSEMWKVKCPFRVVHNHIKVRDVERASPGLLVFVLEIGGGGRGFNRKHTMNEQI